MLIKDRFRANPMLSEQGSCLNNTSRTEHIDNSGDNSNRGEIK